MQIGDCLYFAPGIRFQDLKLDSPEVVQQFKVRIEGYYLEPAGLLAEKRFVDKYAFASVLLLASAIDGMSHFEPQPGKKGNKEQYVAWAHLYVPSLPTEDMALKFYKQIRCGVVHEARAREGGVFTTETGEPIKIEKGLMAVNPQRFGPEVAQVLEAFCNRTANTPNLLQAFQDQIRKDFAAELQAIAPPSCGR
jgi:hypothetical protein